STRACPVPEVGLRQNHSNPRLVLVSRRRAARDCRGARGPAPSRPRSLARVDDQPRRRRGRAQEVGAGRAPAAPRRGGATRAGGKTVMGAALIASRGTSTLVLVHRRPLLEQWVNQLALFLGVDLHQIGRIGGGKNNPNGMLDVAMIQSLVREGEVSAVVGD